MFQFADSLAGAEAAIAVLPSDAGTFAALSDDELTALPASLAALRQRIEAREALAAGEIARRSTRELGYSGLAQKTGFRTPEKLVQHLTGTTQREAGKLVRTGVMIHEAEALKTAEQTGTPAPELTRPWLTTVGRAVSDGTISLEAAEAIRLGLGTPSLSVPIGVLADAATQLVHEADPASPHPLNADQVLDRARSLRNELDEAGIADREAALYGARSFKRYRRPDGMTAYTLLADPENAAYVDGIYDALTSPRRGGPRMVDLADKVRTSTIEADPRTTEQLGFDGVLAILRIGVTTDEKTASRNVLGSRRPAVRVLVTKAELDARSGHGHLEGQHMPVAIGTVERVVCESGVVPIAFDTDGRVLDLGRQQRLYTSRQRIALAARDGGCRWPGCDHPPSWTEAHHINQWARDGGRTDVADGILLCRYHHLLLHNNQWRITRNGAEYWLHPPESIDPNRTPRPMPHKSATLRKLLHTPSGKRAPVRTG